MSNRPQRINIADAHVSGSDFQRAVRPNETPASHLTHRDDPFQRGFEQGSAAAAELFEIERDRLIALLEACDALKSEASEEVAAMIAETVMALVTQIVGSVEIDSGLLIRRTKEAVAIIAETDGARTLHLHPEDIPVIEGANLSINIMADEALPRGSVRVGYSAGWVEHGIPLYLDALHEALDLDSPSS